MGRDMSDEEKKVTKKRYKELKRYQDKKILEKMKQTERLSTYGWNFIVSISNYIKFIR